MLCLVHSFIRLRDMDTENIETELFRELRNVVLEKNEEDEMVREIN